MSILASRGGDRFNLQVMSLTKIDRGFVKALRMETQLLWDDVGIREVVCLQWAFIAKQALDCTV